MMDVAIIISCEREREREREKGELTSAFLRTSPGTKSLIHNGFAKSVSLR
jgi:hypothetical protein